MTEHFVNVTEIEGQRISAEQLFRTCHRYEWAARIAHGKDVLEVACGAGQGLGLLNDAAKSLVSGDVSPEVLANARRVYGDDLKILVFSAEHLPFPTKSFDILLIFEALYYIPHVQKFLAEARRVLRPEGKLLIVSANKDLSDFTPSPYAHHYLGVPELAKELRLAGFVGQFGGLIDIRLVSVRQKLLRPVKAIAGRLGIMPRTMHGKAFLKKLFFGEMTTMPADIRSVPLDYVEPAALSPNGPDHFHKVIYCCATLT